jgi:ABC-type sugar transport system ATPase subunit
MKPIVEMKGITKFIFGRDGKALRNTDVKILDHVDLRVEAGLVHVLVGENGAGKSTLMKVLGGIIPPDEGELLIDGERVSLRDPRDARAKGIAFIHQELNLCSNLDIAHNIFLGREPRRGAVKNVALMYSESRRLLESLSSSLDPRTIVAKLSTAEQQVIEIAKAISFESRVIIMDEPTASLTKREIDVLFRLIREMKQRGMGVIYISHRFEELLEIGDQISVLRDGRSVGSLPISEFDPERVVTMMAGRQISAMHTKTHVPGNETVLEVRGLKLTARTQPIDISVRRGEVVGLGGLVGSGRTELAKSVFGARTFPVGEVVYLGHQITGISPQAAVRDGIAYLSEDRKGEGLVLGMTVRENISLSCLGEMSSFGLISKMKEMVLADKYVRDLRISARSAEQVISTLSGGNQQKCVLAKWLATAPKLLILDEPTRGIDVGSKAQIHALIDEIASFGVAILLISSDLPELLSVSDRIYVMRDGAVVKEFVAGPELTQEAVVKLIVGSLPHTNSHAHEVAHC